ncbi:hypothetical protein C8J57DRAFT_1233054 [Mycena rebaudengoi]|nr:hypothetical protein C8J57DRAFT_1233054 [Mycena rebaudengoi]
MKTEHAAVKKPRILQDIVGAKQADIAELGQKGTVNEGNNPQCVAQHEAAHRCGFGQDGDSLIDPQLYIFLRHTTVSDLASYASERGSSVEVNGERLHDSCGAVGIEIALRKALWRKHLNGDNT